MAMLSAAWWAAKTLGLRAAVGRFFNAQMGVALVASLAVFALVIGGVWTWKQIEAGAVAPWQAKLMQSRWVATLRDRAQQREADARAAAERDKYLDTLRAATTHAAELEQQLAAATENPVCYPATITKELRK